MRPSNLTRDEHRGLKSLRKRKQEGEIVVFETDKSKLIELVSNDNSVMKLVDPQRSGNRVEI